MKSGGFGYLFIREFIFDFQLTHRLATLTNICSLFHPIALHCLKI